MLKKAVVPKKEPAPIAGQWGGFNGAHSCITYQQLKRGLKMLLEGKLPIQSTDESSMVVSRDSAGNEELENRKSVAEIKQFFGVPMKDDTPAVEVIAVFTIAGTSPPSTGYVNAADFINDYNAVFYNDNATLQDAVAFLTKYFEWQDTYASSVLENHNIIEE